MPFATTSFVATSAIHTCNPLLHTYAVVIIDINGYKVNGGYFDVRFVEMHIILSYTVSGCTKWGGYKSI